MGRELEELAAAALVASGMLCNSFGANLELGGKVSIAEVFLPLVNELHPIAPLTSPKGVHKL